MTTYCEFCISEQEMVLQQLEVSLSFRGTDITTTITTCNCKKCGRAIWNDQIERDNMNKIYAIYKSKVNSQKATKINSKLVCSKCGKVIGSLVDSKERVYCPYCSNSISGY